MTVIGIDLGGTKLAGAIFDFEGVLLRQETVHLEGRQGRAVGILVESMIGSLLREGTSVEAVGISVPGIANTREGTVWAPNIPGWEAYPLIREVKEHLGLSIPVVMDSDRACYILGESWKGKARGCRHAVFLAVGTGIGAGILTDGHILRGAHDIAGAVGWLALSRPYRPEYQSCGDFEYHASGPGLVKVALDLLAADDRYRGPLRTAEDLTARDIFTHYEKGDPIAERTLDQAIAYWGMTVANLVSIFNPEMIIFGGGVFGPAGRFLERIEREARQWAQPISMGRVRLEVSALGGDAGLIGAGALALRSLAP